MSYNSFSGCRTSFSPCQYAKIQDVLLGCRSNLCDATVVRAASTTYEICAGESVPTLTAISSCSNWYADIGNGTVALASNTSSFTPSIGVGAGQLDNMTPGTYTFYIGDAIEYNSNCRTLVQVIVSDGAGAGSPATVGNGEVPFSVTNTTASTDANNRIGYLFTTTDPATIANPATVIGAAATTTGTTLGATNQIIQSTGGELTNYTLDCETLGGGTYYLTPFVAYGESTQICTATGTGNNVNFTSGSGGAISSSVGPVTCTPTGLTLVDFSLELEITSCEMDGNDFYINLRDPATNGCGSVSFGGSTPTINCAVGNTYIFDMAAINAVVPGFDPLADALCVSAINTAGSSNGNGLSYSLTLNATYSGNNGFEVWDASGSPALSSDPDCILGAPVEISCLTATPVELYTFSGQLNEGIVRLDWKTISEENNDYFTLSRSADGRNFTTIAKVKGNGTTLDAHTYQHLDKEPMSGLNYYRLQQTDFDGTIVSVGSIVVVDNDKLPVGIQVRPNPIRSGELALSATVEAAGNLEVQIYSMNGALMFRTQTNVTRGHNRLTFKVDDLPNGVYLLKTLKDQVVYTERFVKTN